MDAEHAARVLPGGAGLAAEARRVAGVLERERVGVEHLARVHGGQGHLGRAREVELVALDAVEVHLVRGEEAGAVHGLLADEHRRQDGREALRGQPVEREAVERQLEARRGPDTVDEARARDLGAALRVDTRELEVVARLEGERRRVADAPELDGVVVREAVGGTRVRGCRNAVEQLGAPALGGCEILLELLELGLHAPELLDLLGGRLALELRLRAQLVRLGHEREPGAVGLHERVELLRGALALERGAVGVRVGPRSPDVDHARESRTASITWATPSSSADGQTQSATSSTRACAFATATPNTGHSISSTSFSPSPNATVRSRLKPRCSATKSRPEPFVTSGLANSRKKGSDLEM